MYNQIEDGSLVPVDQQIHVLQGNNPYTSLNHNETGD
jgi:hypothetical protein